MGKYDKLLSKILEGTSDANIRFDELCQLLLKLGFEERICGSHHIFRREGKSTARCRQGENVPGTPGPQCDSEVWIEVIMKRDGKMKYVKRRKACVVLKKVDTIIRIFFSLCYFLSFVESVDKLKTHAAYLAEGVW